MHYYLEHTPNYFHLYGWLNDITLKRGLTTKLHLCCASAKFAFVFHLSPGNNHDAPEGRKLIETIYSEDNHNLLMDRAYEDDLTHALGKEHGFNVIVPPKKNRKEPLYPL